MEEVKDTLAEVYGSKLRNLFVGRDLVVFW